MSRILALLLLALGLTACTTASACHVIRPDPKSLADYQSIFLGTVTGIHLQGVENQLLGKPDAFIDGEAISLTDGSSPVSVRAVADTQIRGNVESAVELKLVGCTNTLPELEERGIFFVNASGTSAVTVWESNSQEFSAWLTKLGVAQDGR